MGFADAGARRVIGVDFTFEMLRHAQGKASESSEIIYAAGDATRLPIADASVDIVSIAFGIRNVADPSAAVAEFRRVLRPGGRLVVLEFDTPRQPLLRAGYLFYFRHVMPRTAALIARDRSGAYRYLPRSVSTFIDREGMTKLLTDGGFEGLRVEPLTFGVAVCYAAHAGLER